MAAELPPLVSPGRRAADLVRQRNMRLAAEKRQETEARLRRIKPNEGERPRNATEEEVKQCAEMLNRRMVQVFDPGQRHWYNFFVHMDDDSSGKVSYDEFVGMIRDELRIPSGKMSDEAIDAVWHALDEDNSGLIDTGEFGHFFRLGEHVLEKKEHWRARVLKEKKAVRLEVSQRQAQLLAEHKRRMLSEAEARQRKAAERREQWGTDSVYSTSSTISSKLPWRSPRALVFM